MRELSADERPAAEYYCPMYKRMAIVFVCMLVGIACERPRPNAPVARQEVKREQVLPLTLAGFLKDGPKAEKIEGVCGPNITRNLLNCDIYDGLPAWTITEVTLFVSWWPYKEDNRRFHVPITIKPLTTQHVTVRLGLQLPPDDVRFKLPHKRWSWQPVVGSTPSASSTSSVSDATNSSRLANQCTATV